MKDLESGYAFKPESLDATMTSRTYYRWVWIGKGSPPTKRGHPYRRAWVEWLRERVFKLKPRWRDTWKLNVWKMALEASEVQSLLRRFERDLFYGPEPETLSGLLKRTDDVLSSRMRYRVDGMGLELFPTARAECSCPLGRPLGLPHLDECPRKGSLR